MSLRQIRKLQQHNKEDEGSDKSDSSADSEPTAPRKSAFVLMRASSSSSSSSSSEEEIVSIQVEHDQTRAAIRAPVPRPPLPQRKTKTSRKTDDNATTKTFVSVLDPVLCLKVRMLNPANELRRIFGSQQVDRAGGSRTRNKRGVVIKRRHWLVEPDDVSWPMVVKDVFKMEICSDGSHRLVPELDYENKLRILSRIIITHDIDALYQFVQLYPFNPHGLIQLATILISERSEYETAYQLIRRCLFAIQSCFIPSFHPDKSVILSSDSIFSSCLFRSLLLYAHLLAGQGCSRTSLEVMKLIYAMEGGMSTGAPRTHILLHMDSMAMRAGEYEWLVKFLSYNGLTECLPSSAILFALAQKRLDRDDMIITDSVRRKQILAKNSDPETTDATTALIRAILMFPQLTRTVSSVDVIGLQKKVEPFTNKLIQAFVTKGYPAAVKANDELSRWIDDVLSKAFAECKLSTMNHIQPDWLTEGYHNITSAEFEWGKSSKGAFVEPAPILESEEHVLEVYSEEGFEATRGNRTIQNAPVLSHAVSLESNPVAAFFQTLLPWSTVDHSGTESTPVTAGALLEQLRQRLGMNNLQSDEGHIIRDAQASDEVDSSSSTDEEEIEME